MKKIAVCFIVFLSIFLIPLVNAETTYKTETLKEACAKEELTCEFKEKDYDETLPNIYVFRGDGCGYCKRLLSFLASIMDEYGKYANVVVYEVGNNQDNWELYKKVGEKFGKEVSGYPYMVIGKEPFDGYANSMDEEIKTTIKNLNEEEKYDVIEEVLNGNMDKIESTKKETNRGPVLAFIFGVIAVIGIFVGYKIFSSGEKNEN